MHLESRIVIGAMQLLLFIPQSTQLIERIRAQNLSKCIAILNQAQTEIFCIIHNKKRANFDCSVIAYQMGGPFLLLC